MNYLQKSFSDGWLKAKVEPVKVDYKGKKIDAYRISMTPYVGDKNESKMQGWEGAKYDVGRERSGAGRDRRSDCHLPQPIPAGMLKLSERITLDGVTGLESPQ